MRVILGADAIHRPLTGIGRYAFELAARLRHLIASGDLTFFSAGRWVRWEELSGIDTRSAIPDLVTDGRGRGSFAEGLRARLAANRLAVKVYQSLAPGWYGFRLRHFRDHVFHAPNYIVPPHPGAKVATIHDLSHIFYPRFHPSTRVEYLNKLLPRSIESADLLITVSDSVRNELLEHFRCPPDRVMAIPHGVDPIFRPRSAADVAADLESVGLRYGGYTLYVGTVEPRKNLGMLLSAYESLSSKVRRAWPLVVAGSPGWHSGDVHDRFAEAQKDGWLVYLRYVSQGFLPSLYSGARLFVYPSVYEGFGLPALEALASGLPVVCSSASALREVVGSAGRFVPHADVDAWREEILMTLQDDRRCDKATVDGPARASAFSWDKCASETVAAYARALEFTETGLG